MVTGTRNGSPKLGLVRKPISSVRPSPENDKLYRPVNPRDPEIVALAKSIKQNGLLEPIVITRDLRLLASAGVSLHEDPLRWRHFLRTSRATHRRHPGWRLRHGAPMKGPDVGTFGPQTHRRHTVPKERQLLLPGFKCTETGLVPNKGLTEEQWESAMCQMGHIETRRGWYVGDLVNSKKEKWDYGSLQDICDSFGFEYSSANSCSVVCRAFELVRRRTSLTFGHHAEVANRDDADELLDWCEENDASVKDLREAIDSVIDVDLFNEEIDAEKHDAVRLGLIRESVHEQLAGLDLEDEC